ncbi:hypothetical protein HMI54_013270 [Coelomomyces lativittatus]|nr:hypothetical protein HMI55_001165 [Coelomomyces lativittatus]KAJ1509437.1 hypothetical protein HMI56_006785 [Coelomomyces lativittatus]KAJ1514886.1 hypothetical protein HMI54_013270 [Coelomomyces lativittatus]
MASSSTSTLPEQEDPNTSLASSTLILPPLFQPFPLNKHAGEALLKSLGAVHEKKNPEFNESSPALSPGNPNETKELQTPYNGCWWSGPVQLHIASPPSLMSSSSSSSSVSQDVTFEQEHEVDPKKKEKESDADHTPSRQCAINNTSTPTTSSLSSSSSSSLVFSCHLMLLDTHLQCTVLPSSSLSSKSTSGSSPPSSPTSLLVDPIAWQLMYPCICVHGRHQERGVYFQCSQVDSTHLNEEDEDEEEEACVMEVWVVPENMSEVPSLYDAFTQALLHSTPSSTASTMTTSMHPDDPIHPTSPFPSSIFSFFSNSVQDATMEEDRWYTAEDFIDENDENSLPPSH